jgi:hypothetical protein
LALNNLRSGIRNCRSDKHHCCVFKQLKRRNEREFVG